ncbi:hypothetical protein KE621_05300 [Shewanella algae]|uniref:hypothetical protein n=1 Tax=Shewanella algae TaxID=38313 RepID=UPI000E3C66AD|nr:hypothetical protein KE621_05300 [Shewanella algae]
MQLPAWWRKQPIKQLNVIAVTIVGLVTIDSGKVIEGGNSDSSTHILNLMPLESSSAIETGEISITVKNAANGYNVNFIPVKEACNGFLGV